MDLEQIRGPVLTGSGILTGLELMGSGTLAGFVEVSGAKLCLMILRGIKYSLIGVDGGRDSASDTHFVVVAKLLHVPAPLCLVCQMGPDIPTL